MNSRPTISFLKNNFLLLLILVAAAVLRFYNLGNLSFSNDELSALTRAQFDSFAEMIEGGVMIDFHPAGVQTFIFYWMKIFGDGVFALRFPFAVAGIFSVLMIYLLTESHFGKSAALLAASALCFLEFPLTYSQLARPYSFGVLFILLSAYFWTKLVFCGRHKNALEKKQILNYTGFVFSMSAATHTHYFALMLAGIIGISGLFYLKKSNYKQYILSGIIIVLLFVPELKILTHQMSIGGLSSWLGKPNSNFLPSFLYYCFNNSNFIIYLFTSILIAGFLLVKTPVKFSSFHFLLLAWFFLPFVVGYYYSIWRNPVLQYSTLLFGFPFFLIFLISFITENFVSVKFRNLFILAFLLTGTFNTVIAKKYYNTYHFGVFKEIAEQTIKWKDQYGGENITSVINLISPKYIQYYFAKMNRKVDVSLYKTEEQEDLARLMELTDTTTTPYFLYAWTNIGHPPEAIQIIKNKFPLVIENHFYFNSEVTLFKKGSDSVSFKLLFQKKIDFEDSSSENELLVRNNSFAHTGSNSQKLNDQTEFSISYTENLRDIKHTKNTMVSGSAWFFTPDSSADAALVLSFERYGKPFEWYSNDFKKYNLHPGKWQQIVITRPLPELKTGNETIKFYVWNPNKQTFYIDDLELKIEDWVYQK